jgi:hypothetical protein
LAEETKVDREKDGVRNSHEGGTSMEWLYSVVVAAAAHNDDNNE